MQKTVKKKHRKVGHGYRKRLASRKKKEVRAKFHSGKRRRR